MSSINDKATVDQIIANNGRGNPRIVEIIEYANIFDGRTTYKLIYKGDNAAYIRNNLACRSQKTLWVAK